MVPVFCLSMCFAIVGDDIRSWRKEKLFLEDLFYIYKEFAVSGKTGFKNKDDLEKKIREKVVNRVRVCCWIHHRNIILITEKQISFIKLS